MNTRLALRWRLPSIVQCLLTSGLLTLSSNVVVAATNYVSLSGTHTPPFASWATAATNIQVAVDATAPGDMVLVNSGVYVVSSHVAVQKAVTVDGIHGAAATVVQSSFPASTNRCFLVTSNAVVRGFTMTNGRVYSGSGGGAFVTGGGLVEECRITGNAVWGSGFPCGGGVACDSFGAVWNCVITGNSASQGDCHLDPLSPCVNAGTNLAWMTGAVDLDGHARIKRSTVDIGAYESVITALYVSVSGAHIWPFDAWSRAATNIHAAAALAFDDSTIFVSNGEYRISAEISLTNGGAMRGIAGAAATVVRSDGSARCLRMRNTIVDGITFTGGSAQDHPRLGGTECAGGGVYAEAGMLLNCVVATNTAIWGMLRWYNLLTMTSGYASVADTDFAISNIPLGIGTNSLMVWGCNMYGETNDTIDIYCKSMQESSPRIASNALVFPSAGSVLLDDATTNIVWTPMDIVDDMDGTNLTINLVTVLPTNDLGHVGSVTGGVANLDGTVAWAVPEYLVGSTTYYIRFDVVDSTSLTSSMVFTMNPFTVVPEPTTAAALVAMCYALLGRARRQR